MNNWLIGINQCFWKRDQRYWYLSLWRFQFGIQVTYIPDEADLYTDEEIGQLFGGN